MKKSILSLAAAAFALADSSRAHGEGVTFLAILSGGEEVPANNSRARGLALFRLASDGANVHYTLIVANLHNPVAAHVHSGGAGANGPVVVPLFSGTAGGGRFSGILAEGTFAATEELLLSMAEGKAYVNVHTNDGVAPPGAGPGDLPAGEIRGQTFAVAEDDLE